LERRLVCRTGGNSIVTIRSVGREGGRFNRPLELLAPGAWCDAPDRGISLQREPRSMGREGSMCHTFLQ
jgi:hypothetical protein